MLPPVTTIFQDVMPLFSLPQAMEKDQKLHISGRILGMPEAGLG